MEIVIVKHRRAGEARRRRIRRSTERLPIKCVRVIRSCMGRALSLLSNAPGLCPLPGAGKPCGCQSLGIRTRAVRDRQAIERPVNAFHPKIVKTGGHQSVEIDQWNRRTLVGCRQKLVKSSASRSGFRLDGQIKTSLDLQSFLLLSRRPVRLWFRLSPEEPEPGNG
ncbi:hypothetical protein [Palleronia aestuarii]|nr:hypothetical protein [Palleronia aestuarii]